MRRQNASLEKAAVSALRLMVQATCVSDCPVHEEKEAPEPTLVRERETTFAFYRKSSNGEIISTVFDYFMQNYRNSKYNHIDGFLARRSIFD